MSCLPVAAVAVDGAAGALPVLLLLVNRFRRRCYAANWRNLHPNGTGNFPAIFAHSSHEILHNVLTFDNWRLIDSLLLLWLLFFFTLERLWNTQNTWFTSPSNECCKCQRNFKCEILFFFAQNSYQQFLIECKETYFYNVKIKKF